MIEGNRGCLTVLAVCLLLTGCGGTDDGVPDPTAFVASGESLFASEGCVRCHGEQGQGGIGPALAGGAVLETFPACPDQLRWVSLGSAGWGRDVGPTYGATAQPVRGGMPGFAARLDDTQLAAVVTYTRVAFGGADPAQAVDDCTG